MNKSPKNLVRCVDLYIVIKELFVEKKPKQCFLIKNDVKWSATKISPEVCMSFFFTH